MGPARPTGGRSQGVILAGYVGTWFAALRAAPATTVTSILVGGAVVTGVLSAADRGALPGLPVAAGYLLIVLAVVAIAIVSSKRRSALRDAALDA